MTDAAFQIRPPERATSGVVFASPHSGRHYPAAFLSQTVLDSHEIRSSEDAFVDQLYQDAPDFGATLMTATYPRAYLDLNRAADELDPALIHGVPKRTPNPRINSGLGVIPRVVARSRAIYRGKLSGAEAQHRIKSVWEPYHCALQNLLNQRRAEFGQAILVDCHSMPSEAVANVVHHSTRTPEVILGDRFGASASGAVVDRIEAAFQDAGFYVLRNAPFAGAYVAKHYGRPAHGQHCVQVELNRALYMDEAQITPRADFDAFRAVLNNVIRDIAQIGQASDVPLAAE